MERAQMSIDWWMDKEYVVYTHNAILLSDQKEWNLTICNDVDWGGVYYVNEISQLEKNKFHMITLICGL